MNIIDLFKKLFNRKYVPGAPKGWTTDLEQYVTNVFNNRHFRPHVKGNELRKFPYVDELPFQSNDCLSEPVGQQGWILQSEVLTEDAANELLSKLQTQYYFVGFKVVPTAVVGAFVRSKFDLDTKAKLREKLDKDVNSVMLIKDYDSKVNKKNK